MKKIIVLLVLGISFSTQAQKLDRIESLAKIQYEIQYYETQKSLWEKEIEKNVSNQQAWLNSYFASRAMRIISKIENEFEKAEIYNTQCIDILKKVSEKQPNSYAFYVISCSEKGVEKGSEDLLKAEPLMGDDTRIIDELMIHYEMAGNKAKKEYYAKRMYETNEIPSSILNWAYNLLSEVESNAIVFTAGDMDTYALWVVQSAKNYRSDISIMNYQLFDIDSYRSLVLQNKVNFPKDILLSQSDKNDDVEKNKSILLKKVFESSVPVYVSTTAHGFFYGTEHDYLYLTGLAYKHSYSNFDNQKIIVQNYESVYLLDHLKESFAYHEFRNKETDFNCMYLPSLLKLYTYYKTNGNLAKMDEIQPLLEDLGSKCQQDEQVNKCLNIEEMKLISSANFNAKRMEKSYLRVKEKVFMQEAEVTNYEYGLYLTYLKENKMDNALKVAQYDSTQWEKKFKYTIHDPMTDLYAWHPAYQNYPIVNITYEGATAYCNWLTQQYNQQKKRSYKKVVFRLPTKAEWLEMATAGKPTELNPFPGGTIKNQSGCYLANIKPTPTSFFEDGGFHSVRVDSYNPNNLGFYNSFGNVSEMINVKGAAMGGSWYNLYEECTFDKTQNYTGADPGIGFRVVMEIIEQ